MNPPATSKEALLQTAKRIAMTEGLDRVSIRRTAAESGVAVGTVYHYYPAKADLILAVVEDFWRGTFHDNGPRLLEGDSFTGLCADLYETLRNSLRQFEGSFLRELSRLEAEEQAKGRRMERQYQEHMRQGMLAVLARDPRVRPEVWGPDFTPEELVRFAFFHITARLRAGEEDCAFLLQVLERLLY